MIAPLSSSERERGWVEFHCPAHGGLVATTSLATVTCECGKSGVPMRDGKRLHREQLRRLKSSQ